MCTAIMNEPRPASTEQTILFHCNLCGAPSECALSDLTREAPTCAGCGSSVRVRSVIHLLSLALFGTSLCLDRFPVDKGVRGLGLSDWEPYALRLADRFDYTNTYFDREPRLDITSAGGHEGDLDFLIASEVFEHVAPPVDRAFRNAARLLKPDGVLIFTVPFGVEPQVDTIEHFPGLHEFHIDQGEDAAPALVNTTAEGEVRRGSRTWYSTAARE